MLGGVHSGLTFIHEKFYSRSDLQRYIVCFFSLKGSPYIEMASWKQETHGFFGVRNFESEKTHGDWEVDKKLGGKSLGSLKL